MRASLGCAAPVEAIEHATTASRKAHRRSMLHSAHACAEVAQR
jgi:hypothetical protein